MEPGSSGHAAASGTRQGDPQRPAGDPQRLQRVLGVPELGWLVDRIRARLERGEPIDGTVTLVGATGAQRKAVARLLGHSIPRGTSLSVPLPEVAAVLRRTGVAPNLRAAVVALTGPVRDRAAERSTEVQRWQQALAQARHSRLATTPWHAAWLDEIVRGGTLTRLIRQDQSGLLAQATAVLERLQSVADARAGLLSAQGEDQAVLLPALAQAVAGDPGALAGTPLAGLVLHALALRESVPAPASPAAERALWTLAGVVTDDLTSQLLVLNVRASGEPLGRWLTEAAEAGEPFRLTLHQMTVMPLMPLAIDLYVCEHPAVLRAAAGQFGADCAPLVCTEGEPSVACFRLLQAAVTTSTRLHWHGDFDWPGLRTTAAAVRRLGAVPWLMGADDYRDALSAGKSEPLKGAEAASPWDPRLAELMHSRGRAVTEQAMLPRLLGVLGAWQGLR